jgi:hypothetical protein
MNEKHKYENVRTHDAAPIAGSMIESLRDLGYTPETAIADIVDNAIFAKARNIWIDFHWNAEQSRVTFRDDGIGMTEEELIQAMRPGSQSPSEKRDCNDLGRFGLGLKTASFSQCRVFTVISRREAIPVTYWRWDIDYVTDPSTNGWKIVQTADKDDIRLIEEMGAGTIVIWENLDRIIEPKKRHKNGEDDFYAVASRVKRHLEMVFHRYLETGKLKIIFNGIEVHPDQYR